MTKPKNKAIPFVAAFILLYGIVAVLTARVAFLDGIHEAIGNHARGIGFFSIAFSIWIFFSYFRHRNHE
jgi:hypothetical protein